MEWDISPVLINLGFIQIRWYGALFALGFYFGYRMVGYVFSREGISLAVTDRFFVHIFFGALIGARLGHCFFYEPDIFLRDPIRILKIWEGGLASHGAAIGTIFSVCLFSRKFKNLTFLQLCDRLMIGVALCSAMIRIGNFFNSEILGKPTDLPWAIRFMKIDGVPRHPAMLYESIVCFCIFGLIYFLITKTKALQFRGFLFGVLLSLVFTARFFIEFLKEAQVPFEVGMKLNMGQLLSIPAVMLGLIMIVLSIKNNSSKETLQS